MNAAPAPVEPSTFDPALNPALQEMRSSHLYQQAIENGQETFLDYLEVAYEVGGVAVRMSASSYTEYSRNYQLSSEDIDQTNEANSVIQKTLFPHVEGSYKFAYSYDKKPDVTPAQVAEAARILKEQEQARMQAIATAHHARQQDELVQQTLASQKDEQRALTPTGLRAKQAGFTVISGGKKAEAKKPMLTLADFLSGDSQEKKKSA